MEETRDANIRALKLVTQAELTKGYCDFFLRPPVVIFPYSHDIYDYLGFEP